MKDGKAVVGKNGKPALKGGGFVLTQDGKLAGLTDTQLLRATHRVLAGEMPPGEPLDQKEGPALMQYLGALSRKGGAK